MVPYMSDLISKNIWLARVVYFTLMIAGSILIEIIIENLQKAAKWVFMSSKDNITLNT